MIIDKIIVVEGLDKTGKSTFCNSFETIYKTLNGINANELKRTAFPNNNLPIGKSIRTELSASNPAIDIINTPNFLADMAHFWMKELYNLHYNNITTNSQNNINQVSKDSSVNYIFDRYFISTLAYQAFYNNSKTDLEFIKTSLKVNGFIKIPTDLIIFDLPNSKIIERTLQDQSNGLVDNNDTLDESIINARRKAYKDAVHFLKGMGINIHWFEDVSLFETDDLVKVLMGKIFR